MYYKASLSLFFMKKFRIGILFWIEKRSECNVKNNLMSIQSLFVTACLSWVIQGLINSHCNLYIGLCLSFILHNAFCDALF